MSDPLRSAIQEGDREGALREAGSLLAAGSADRLIATLLDLLVGDSAWNRAGAVALLSSISPDSALLRPLLQALGEGEHPERRNAARSALAALATPGAADPFAPLPELSALLTQAPDRDVRILSANALGESANPRAREALQSALQDPDPNVVAAAAEALGALRDPRALEPLVELAEKGDFWTGSAAVVALGELGDSRAIPALSRLIANPGLGGAAAAALGCIGDPAALDALRQAADLPAPTRDEAIRAAASLIAATPDTDAPDWLRDAARQGEEALASRFRAEGDLESARLLGIAGTARAAEVLLDQLADDADGAAAVGLGLLPREVRQRAILGRLDRAGDWELATLLGLLPPLDERRPIEVISRFLLHEGGEVRAAAAEALGRSNEEEVIALLEDLRRQPAARLGAARTYARLGSARCVALFDLLRDDDPEVRAAAAEGTARCGLGTAKNLGEVLRHEHDPRVRRALVRALGSQGGPDAVTELRRVIGTDDAGLRFEAVQALGCTGSPEAFPLLMSALSDPEPGVRTVALSALGELGDARAAEPLTEHVDDPDRDRRRIATVAIGRLFGAESIERLTTALQDPDREVRLVAVSALEKLRLGASIPMLERVAEEDPDPLVRHKAAGVAAGLQSLAGEVP